MKQDRSTLRSMVVVSLVVGFCVACAQEAPVSKTATETQTQTVNEAARMDTMAARFAPTEIVADLSRLSPAERQILAKLVQASKIMDALYLRQVWAGNEAMLLDLIPDQTPEGRA